MTCVVALRDSDGEIYIGADSAQTGGTHQDLTAQSKVAIIGDCIVGTSGSIRQWNVLQYLTNIPPYDKKLDPYEWMVREFTSAMRQSLIDNGVNKKHENADKSSSTVIVGLLGRIFTIYSDYCVCEWTHPYQSIGCGNQFAIGSLAATERSKMDAEERVRLALEVASRFDSCVAGPFTILSLPEKSQKAEINTMGGIACGVAGAAGVWVRAGEAA